MVNLMAIKQYQLTYLRRYWALLVLLVTRCIRRERLWDTTKIWGRMFGLWDENEKRKCVEYGETVLPSIPCAEEDEVTELH